MTAAADGPIHRYSARIAWTGSTADGYDSYTRAHEATCPPLTSAIAIEPTFRRVSG
ncbi:MAG TPA: hypothetical protein VN635_15700 [Conexibacter sp.]|nr:hypothetical protein [Conexibacter sp.]